MRPSPKHPLQALALLVLVMGALLVVPISSAGPLAPSTAAAQSAGAAPEVCINVQPPSAATAPGVLADLQRLGINCIRTSWWAWSIPDSWSWCHVYRRAGIEVLPLVYDVGGDYRERFRRLNAACGPFRYVQLGNEMDGGLQAGREARAVGRLWGTRLRDAAPLVRASGARVVGPGLAWNSPGVRDYLEGMLETAGSSLDVVAIHTYGVHVYGEPVSRWKEVRKHGWRGPVWITEIGVSNVEAAGAGRNPDEWQKENIEGVLRDPSLPGLDRLYWFQYSQATEGWGLLRMNGTRRPAFESLRRR
jgi:hypothetical protein